jgi:hypothetical protein
MSPAERRRRMNAAQLRSLGQALALDRRARVIEPFLLLAQMRHWRLGQRIEGAPAALAAKPQPMRAAPADDLAARAMGTALSRDALVTGRSERVLLAGALAARLRRSSRLAPNPLAFSSAAIAAVRCPSFIPEIADSQAAKSSAFIESLPRSDKP